MLRAGDEFLQTQGGNSNPYNQDSETTWLDWRRRAVIDTARPSPEGIALDGGRLLARPSYVVDARSLVVLERDRTSSP